MIENFKTLKRVAYASSIGIVLVSATFIGLGIGYFLDSRFETTPCFTLLGLLLGIISGCYNGYEMVKKIIKE